MPSQDIYVLSPLKKTPVSTIQQLLVSNHVILYMCRGDIDFHICHSGSAKYISTLKEKFK